MQMDETRVTPPAVEREGLIRELRNVGYNAPRHGGIPTAIGNLMLAAADALSPTLHPADREEGKREVGEALQQVWKAVTMADREAAARTANALGVPDVQGERQLELIAREFARARLLALCTPIFDGEGALSGSLAPAEGGEPRGGLGGERTCRHCGGEGDIDDGDHPCFTCGGTGKVPSAALPPSTEKGETK